MLGHCSALLVLLVTCLFFPWLAQGQAGHALYFDHRRSDIMLFRWKHTAAVNHTFECWLKATDSHVDWINAWEYSAFDASVTPFYEALYEIEVAWDVGKLEIWRSDSARYCYEPACHWDPLQPPGWTHLAYSIQSDNAIFSLYINGTLIFHQQGMGDSPSSDPDNFFTPLRPNGLGRFGQTAASLEGKFNQDAAFSGLIDEVRIWDRILTAEEIASHYTTTVNPNSPGLNVYFNFDQPHDDIVPDLSGNGHDATLGDLLLLRNVMTWEGKVPKPPGLPTKPRFVKSQAPISGAPWVEVVASASSACSLLLRPSLDYTAGNATPGNATLGDFTVTFLQVADGSQGVLYEADNVTAIAFNHTFVFQSGAPLFFHPGPAFAEGQAAVFRYQVNGSAVVELQLRARTVLAPPDLTVRTDEDEMKIVVLHGVDDEGQVLEVEVTSLPAKGHLFEVVFDRDGTYTNFLADAMVPLTEDDLPYRPADPSAAFAFVGEPGGAAGDQIYANFSYRWTARAASASVFIYVAWINDAPAVQSAAMTLSAHTDSDVLCFQGADEDPTAANTIFYFLDVVPKLGTLYSYDKNNNQTSAIAPESKFIQYAWAADVMAFSSQYTLCLPTETSCKFTDWHATQILGPADAFPDTGDTKVGWGPDPEDDTNIQWIELDFGSELFLSSIDIYEVYLPGSVISVQACNEYQGAETAWQHLWDSDPDFNNDGKARIFSPPLCPTARPVRYVRIELDITETSLFNLDAVKAQGTQEAAQLIKGNCVKYVARAGLYSSDTGGLYDSFSIAASDCEARTSPDALTVFPVYNPIPEEAAAASMLQTVQVEEQLDYGEEITINISNHSGFSEVWQGMDGAAIEQVSLRVATGQLHVKDPVAGSVVKLSPTSTAAVQLTGTIFHATLSGDTADAELLARIHLSGGYVAAFSLRFTADCDTVPGHLDWGSGCVSCSDVDPLKLPDLAIASYERNCGSEMTAQIIVGVIFAMLTIFPLICIFVVFRYKDTSLQRFHPGLLLCMCGAAICTLQFPVMLLADANYPCGLYYWGWVVMFALFATSVAVDAVRRSVMLTLAVLKQKLAIKDRKINIEQVQKLARYWDRSIWVKMIAASITSILFVSFLVYLFSPDLEAFRMPGATACKMGQTFSLPLLLMALTIASWVSVAVSIYHIPPTFSPSLYTNLGEYLVATSFVILVYLILVLVVNLTLLWEQAVNFLVYLAIFVHFYRSVGVDILRAIPALSHLHIKKTDEGQEANLLDIISTNRGYKFFLLFCMSEYSEENILCWHTIMQFKVKTSRKRYREIYEDYLAPGAPMRVNLPSKLFDEQHKLYKRVATVEYEALQSSLDDVLQALLNLMDADTRLRFLVSPLYTAYRKGDEMPPNFSRQNMSTLGSGFSNDRMQVDGKDDQEDGGSRVSAVNSFDGEQQKVDMGSLEISSRVYPENFPDPADVEILPEGEIYTDVEIIPAEGEIYDG